MTTDQLLAFVAERGLRFELLPDGRPTLRGPKEEVTPLLLDMLRQPEYREAIVKKLGGDPSKAPAVVTQAAALPPSEPPAVTVAAVEVSAAPPEPPPFPVLPPVPSPLVLPDDGREIECLWDDGDVVSYPAGQRPFSPVAWRYPSGEWTALRGRRE